MDENLVYEEEKNSADKFFEFMKNNVLNFLLVIIYGLFIFRDVVQIHESGRTILEIIANTFIAWFMGVCTSTIMRRKGQAKAMTENSYKNMQKTYDGEIEKADDHIDVLDDFCDEKNEIRYIKAQKIVLRRQRIKYDDFANKEKNEVCKTKEQEKCWDRALRVKIQLITPENLLSETDTKYEKGKKEETLNEKNTKSFLKDSYSKAFMALIFGYFAVSIVLGTGILWSCIQVSIWLIWGIVSYLQDYFYIKQVYQQKIYRKIKYLKEFNNNYVAKKGEKNYGNSEGFVQKEIEQ